MKEKMFKIGEKVRYLFDEEVCEVKEIYENYEPYIFRLADSELREFFATSDDLEKVNNK